MPSTSQTPRTKSKPYLGLAAAEATAHAPFVFAASTAVKCPRSNSSAHRGPLGVERLGWRESLLCAMAPPTAR